MLLSCLPLDACEGIGLLTWDWRTGAEEPWSCGEPRNISALAPPSFDPVFGFCTFERGRSKVRVLGAKRGVLPAISRDSLLLGGASF